MSLRKQIQGLEGVIEAYERNGDMVTARYLRSDLEKLKEQLAVAPKSEDDMVFIGVGWIKKGRGVIK